jgi:uncharacterized protein YaaQ
MKLVVAVVQHEDGERASEALSAAGFASTRISSSGAFLQQGNITILVGVEDTRVAEALEVIRENCRERSRYLTPVPPMSEPGELTMPYPVEVQVGGATVFVLAVDSFEKI